MANTNVSTIDRQTLQKAIRPALNEKLAELSAELGVQITAAGASYSPDGQNGSIKLELAMISESGVVVTRERRDYEQYHAMYGLPEDGLDKEIDVFGEKLKIAGLRMKARKNNVLLDTCDGSGTQRIAPGALIKNALEKANAA